MISWPQFRREPSRTPRFSQAILRTNGSWRAIARQCCKQLRRRDTLTSFDQRDHNVRDSFKRRRPERTPQTRPQSVSTAAQLRSRRFRRRTHPVEAEDLLVESRAETATQWSPVFQDPRSRCRCPVMSVVAATGVRRDRRIRP